MTVDAVQVPPQDIEAEESVLGAILLDNDAIKAVLAIASVDDFYRESHRLIFQAMIDLTDSTQPVDAITLTDRLRRDGGLERVGGPAYIAELAMRVPTAINAPSYAQIVRRKAAQRALRAEGQRLVEQAVNGQVPEELAMASLERIEGIRTRATAAKPPLGTWASEIEPRTQEWIWDGRFPRGCVVVLDGDPGEGKSSLLIDTASRLSTGVPFPDGAPCEIGTSLLITAEDQAETVTIPRLMAAGGNLSRVRVIPIVRQLRSGVELLSFPENFDLIENTIGALRAVFVVIDPFAAFLSSRLNSKIDADMRRMLAALASIADRTNSSIVAVRHLNKSGGGKAMYRGNGSIGMIAAARAAFLVGHDPDEEDRKVFAPIKINLARKPPALTFRLIQDQNDLAPHVEWISEKTSLTAADLLREPDVQGGDSKFENAIGLISELLAGGQKMRSADLEQAAAARGISERTLNKARRALRIQPFRDREGWSVSLPRVENQELEGEL